MITSPLLPAFLLRQGQGAKRLQNGPRPLAARSLGSLQSCWGQGEGSPETGLTGPGLRLGVLEALLLLKEEQGG